MMKKFIFSAFVAATMSPAISAACTFNFHVYGDSSIRDRIKVEIGNKITDEYCLKYNKKYEIVILVSSYASSNLALGHAVVGLRKKGTKDVPAKNHQGYWTKQGNHAIGVAHDMAASIALDYVADVMSDIPSYIN